MPFSMNNISYSDFQNICRLCMLSCDIKFTQDNIITDVFYKLTDIHFESNVELPQYICQKCFHKINEIHTFAFQCKQTHFSLLQCLNNFKNPRVKEEPDISEEMYEPFKTEEEITIHEHKIGFVKVEASNSTSEYVADELNLKENIEEHKNNEFEEKMIPGTSEDKNINYSNNDLLITQNTLNIKVENEEESNDNANQKASNEDTYSSDTSDNSHIDSAENIKEISKKTKVKNYKCEECLKSFSNSYKLNRHMRMHSGERPFKCEQCSKMFSQSNHLKDHMRVHSGERPYTCEFCSKTFSQTSQFKRHVLTHSSERSYKCELCSKTFLQSFYLSNHMRTHSDERPHKCEQCSKSFLHSYKLKLHMRTHNGERPYKCEQCSRMFSQSIHLKDHMLTHSGERPYKCETCSKAFTRSSYLNKHMRTHSC